MKVMAEMMRCNRCCGAGIYESVYGTIAVDQKLIKERGKNCNSSVMTIYIYEEEVRI